MLIPVATFAHYAIRPECYPTRNRMKAVKVPHGRRQREPSHKLRIHPLQFAALYLSHEEARPRAFTATPQVAPLPTTCRGEVESSGEDNALNKLPIKLPSADRGTFWFVWATIAAFGTYFCMYAFRKPFTAASFEVSSLNDTPIANLLNSWGFIEETDDGTWILKALFVSSQLIGYMLSKIIGIKVVSELRAQYRATAIIILILSAELCLLLFGSTSYIELKVLALFLNGLSLGMIFGFVLGFLEGRRATEALTAGLCASFILAGGVAKSAGTWLVDDMQVSENWMPFTAGLLFLPALFVFVGMLACIPPPTVQDQNERTERVPLDGKGRLAFFWHNAPVISTIVFIFALVTILRSIHDDYAPELFAAMGRETDKEVFTVTQLYIAIVVLVLNGGAALIRNNQRAFFTALWTCIFGFALVLTTVILQDAVIGRSAVLFMVLVGLGLYLPYVAVHTTLFERWIAISKERSNLGFLMYIADSAGYLSYAAFQWVFTSSFSGDGLLPLFSTVNIITAAFSLVVLLSVCVYLMFRRKRETPEWSPTSALEPPQ